MALKCLPQGFGIEQRFKTGRGGQIAGHVRADLLKWEAEQRPASGSLGLLPSGSDPVGEVHVRRQPPNLIMDLGGWRDNPQAAQLAIIYSCQATNCAPWVTPRLWSVGSIISATYLTAQLEVFQT